MTGAACPKYSVVAQMVLVLFLRDSVKIIWFVGKMKQIVLFKNCLLLTKVKNVKQTLINGNCDAMPPVPD